jgi:hypothetical protein
MDSGSLCDAGYVMNQCDGIWSAIDPTEPESVSSLRISRLVWLGDVLAAEAEHVRWGRQEEMLSVRRKQGKKL